MNRSGVLLRLSLPFPGESDGRVVGDHVRSHPRHPYIRATLRYSAQFVEFRKKKQLSVHKTTLPYHHMVYDIITRKRQREG